jgi:DNA-binding LacI/PurR family transcriptional regulator
LEAWSGLRGPTCLMVASICCCSWLMVFGADTPRLENRGLSTLHVPKEAMGATAIKALEARVADPQAVSVTYTLGVRLVIRDSVRPYQQ